MPNRIIKESICQSDSIDSLSWFEEVLFYRLIVSCDDYGRFDGRPAVVKGSCFPLKDDITKKQIADALEKLSTVGLVGGYEVQGRPYLQLTAWDKHQQRRAKNSKYPAPESQCNHMISHDIKCPRGIEESRNRGIEESRSENACAREAGELRLFEDFLSAYPKDCNRFLVEREYASLMFSGKITEDVLLQCARNYAESVRIKETPEDFISNAENFLGKMVFEQYLPGKYRKPEPKRTKNTFNRVNQREYDFDSLEEKLLGVGGIGK